MATALPPGSGPIATGYGMPPAVTASPPGHGATAGGQGVTAWPPPHPHRLPHDRRAVTASPPGHDPTVTGDGITAPRPTAGGYGTTVTGHRPAFTNRTATDPMIRCPACSDAPTMTASALSSSAALTRPP